MNKKAVIFLILFIFSFFVSLFFNLNKINVPYFNGVYREVQVDVIFKNKAPTVFYNQEQIRNYIKIDENHYLFKTFIFKHVKNIYLKDYQNIEKLTIYNGNEAMFVDDVKEIVEIDNNKNILDKFAVILTSFFYNPHLYFISYIFLFLFLYNFQFSFKVKWGIISLLTLGFFLRLAQINHIPFWDDEIYVLTHTNNWLQTIQDPGNPPFYFVLFKIYRFFIHNPDFYRFSAVIMGVLFNVCFYFYLKLFLKSKKALLGLFIVTINIVLIYFSQEIRCYMLLMLLAVINSYFFFKFNNNKNKILYLISSILLLYTHFYATFFVFYNFIFGLILYFKNKLKLKSFILANLVAFLSFLPLLIYKKQSITSNFNSWMEAPKTMDFIIAGQIFAGKITFCIIFFILCVFVYKQIQEKLDRLFFKYNFWLITSIFLFATIFSYLIKPIFCYRYFYVAFPAYLAIITMFVTFDYKIKAKIVMQFAILILLTINSKVNYQNLFCNHNLYIDYVKHDIDKTKTNHIFMSDTVEYYDNFNIDGQNFIYLPVNQGIGTLDIEKYGVNKPSISYVPNLYLTENVIKNAQKIELFKTPLGIFSKIYY